MKFINIDKVPTQLELDASDTEVTGKIALNTSAFVRLDDLEQPRLGGKFVTIYSETITDRGTTQVDRIITDLNQDNEISLEEYFEGYKQSLGTYTANSSVNHTRGPGSAIINSTGTLDLNVDGGSLFVNTTATSSAEGGGTIWSSLRANGGLKSSSFKYNFIADRGNFSITSNLPPFNDTVTSGENGLTYDLYTYDFNVIGREPIKRGGVISGNSTDTIFLEEAGTYTLEVTPNYLIVQNGTTALIKRGINPARAIARTVTDEYSGGFSWEFEPFVTIDNSIPTNTVPIAVDDEVTTNQDIAVAIDVLANDSDPDEDAISIQTFDATSAKGGSITLDDNGTSENLGDDSLVYTPPTGFSGNDSFTYTISDGIDTATATVDVTVEANNPPGSVDDRVVTIDFDADDLAAGTIITDQYEGISISSSTEFGAMLFDTNNITGGDFDLSATDLGNVLIISEDGDSTDPDDNAAGGTISIKFDQLARITSVGLLDIDEEGSSIAFFDDDSNLLEAVEIENLGDNSFQELAFDITDVSRMEVHLAGSGALTGFDFILSSADPTFSQVSAFDDSLSDSGDIFNGTTSVEPF